MYLSLKKVALFVILSFSICLQLDKWYIIPSAAIYFFASYIPKLETYAITVRKCIFGMSYRCLIYFDRALFLNHCISYSFSLFYPKWLLSSILSSASRTLFELRGYSRSLRIQPPKRAARSLPDAKKCSFRLAAGDLGCRFQLSLISQLLLVEIAV